MYICLTFHTSNLNENNKLHTLYRIKNVNIYLYRAYSVEKTKPGSFSENVALPAHFKYLTEFV